MAENPDVVPSEQEAAAQPPEPVTPESHEPDADLADTPEMETASGGIADGTDTCKICEKPIEEGDLYVEAAYGTVHQEPCSHQGYVSMVEGTELSQGNE